MQLNTDSGPRQVGYANAMDWSALSECLDFLMPMVHDGEKQV